MSWRNRVEVSYAALRSNVATIRQCCGDRALIAIVKADAYGLGLERCARIYHEAGAQAVAVAAVGEADRVRRTLPSARILLLGSPLPEERPSVVASGYEVCCTTRDEILEFATLATASRPHPVHLFIDTGMGRAGCRPQDAVGLVRLILGHDHLTLAGVASHYPCAVDSPFSDHQEAVMRDTFAALPPLPEACWIHTANAEALLCRLQAPGNAVRAGLVLPGVVPSGCPNPGLEPAVRWLSSVSLVKSLPAGHGVSYGRQVILERDTTVALVPVGYADGYPFRCSGRSEVLIAGQRCPLLGRVTMDYLIIDVGHLDPLPVPGDQVTLIGRDGDEAMSIDELAVHAETIPYDILCGLRGRCDIVGVP